MSTAAADSSSVLNGVLPSVTTAANLVADKTIEFLRQQQEYLQRQLLKQEILNTNLYQSLIDSGIIPAMNGWHQHRTTTSVAATTTSPSSAASSSNLLELLKSRNLLSGLAGSKSDDSNYSQSPSSSPQSTFHSAPNLANLASIFPISEAFTSLGTVFEKLFGTKFWIYILIALLIGFAFVFFSCLFMYCCCCNRFGKSLLCCCNFSNWMPGGGGGKKAKKKKALDDSSTFKCCV